MARTTFIEHRGKQICLVDLSELKDPQETLAAIAEARGIITSQPKASVRTLTHVTHARFNHEIVTAVKDMTAANKPYVKAGAVVGVTGLKRVIFNAVVNLTGRNLIAFDDLDKAKAWLVSQK